MTKKITFTKSVKRNKTAQNYANSFSPTTPTEQEFSLSRAVKKIAREINKILDHGYSREDVAAILRSGDIEDIPEVRSNNRITNIAIELMPKSKDFNEAPYFHTMASYNDSNRVTDHKTRWNSR
jgi:hypothetical protein